MSVVGDGPGAVRAQQCFEVAGAFALAGGHHLIGNGVGVLGPFDVAEHTERRGGVVVVAQPGERECQ